MGNGDGFAVVEDLEVVTGQVADRFAGPGDEHFDVDQADVEVVDKNAVAAGFLVIC